MCLAIPMRIESIEQGSAVIELGGLSQRTSLLLLPDAKVGDYVLVHAGCAISILDQVEAEERLALFRELAEEMEDAEADLPGGSPSGEGPAGA